MWYGRGNPSCPIYPALLSTMRREAPHYKVLLKALDIELQTLDKGGHQTETTGNLGKFYSHLSKLFTGEMKVCV